MSIDNSIRERLAKIETNLSILVKINNKDHEEMKEEFKALRQHVNDRSDLLSKQVTLCKDEINLMKQNFKAKSVEWNIYRRALVFLAVAIGIGLLTLGFNLLARVLGV